MLRGIRLFAGCVPVVGVGGDSLYPRFAFGWPSKFTLAQRREIKKLALARLHDLGADMIYWLVRAKTRHQQVINFRLSLYIEHMFAIVTG